MTRKIILSRIIKTTIAIIAAVLLCGYVTIGSKNYTTIIFGVMAVSLFSVNLFSLLRDFKNGNIVEICGNCSDLTTERANKLSKVTTTYRFDVATDDGNNSPIFIVGASHKQFHLGVAYCLVFRLSSDGTFNEKNLVGFTPVSRPAAVVLPEKAEALQENTIQFSDIKEKKSE